MAKIKKMLLDGQSVYPVTITNAIYNASGDRKLSDWISGLKLQKSGDSNLVYELVDGWGNNLGTINIPQDTFLNNATFNASSNKLELTFNTESGKSSVEVDLSALVDTYTAGNGLNVANKQFSIKIKDGEKYLEATADGLATKGIDTALENISTSFETQIQDVNEHIEAVESKLGERTDGAATGNTATAFNRIKNLETIVSDLTGGSAESVETQINNAINKLDVDGTSATTQYVSNISQVDGKIVPTFKELADSAPITSLNTSVQDLTTRMVSAETRITGIEALYISTEAVTDETDYPDISA